MFCNCRNHKRIYFKIQNIDSRHFELRRDMQSDTNLSKSSSKNVSRRISRSKKHKTNISDLKKSKNDQKANYSKDSSNQHRNVVSKTIKNAQKTWKHVKWAKNRSTSFKLITFFFRRSNDTMTFIKKAKVQCLIDFFFSSFVVVNLDDIERIKYSKSVDFFEIIRNEINQTIVKIVSSIALNENEILNWVIKIAFSHIILVVKWIFNQNLRLEYCLKHFRKFITMFFRKINKLDYFVFKTYKLIVLLNTLNKIMKSIMTIRLNYTAKKHYLLLKRFFENRKNIISKHVLHYIMKIINSIWISKKITMMLLLNVIKVFDNVSHFRLLHNLKKRRIESTYLIWIKSFFAKRYIILKLMNHIIDRIRIAINVFQKSSMSLILYVFYNANLIN